MDKIFIVNDCLFIGNLPTEMRFSVKKYLLLVCIFCVSCASVTPVSFVGPNGKQAYSMKCSGLGRTLDACYQKAGEVCPSGYNIVNVMSGSVAVSTASGGILAAPSHNIAIECK